MTWILSAIGGSIIWAAAAYVVTILTKRGHPVDVFATGVGFGIVAALVWAVLVFWASPYAIVIEVQP